MVDTEFPSFSWGVFNYVGTNTLDGGISINLIVKYDDFEDHILTYAFL